MSIEVKVIEDTVGEKSGKRITTLQLRYHRFFHSEFMTHRVFSRNASSSRAIPVKKMMGQVWNDPAIPLAFHQNKAGMQGGEEIVGFKKAVVLRLWKMAGCLMVVFAWLLSILGVHKQIANRLLEPWQFIHVVLTASEWENFFTLRCHKDAQPEIQELAKKIRAALANNFPKISQYHLPYIMEDEINRFTIKELMLISAARCARVSYMKHDGTKPKTDEDLALAEKLSTSGHMSPFEHQGIHLDYTTPVGCWYSNRAVARSNLKDFIQFRKLLEAYNEQF